MAVIKSLPATKSLSNQLKYLEKEGKTVEELKEGINCTTDNVEREFNIVKQLHNKAEGKQYYHFTQAFSPEDNITPDKAHQLGKEWIERNIQGHQVYMVTHIDKNHIHNHFVINSVNMDNGLKLQISPSKLLKMKKDSNCICDREKLSKINLEQNKGISKTDSEYRLEKKGVTPWKDELRQCIDFGRSKTKSIEELKEYLKEHFNIEVRETKNSISYKHPEQNKSVRGNKLGGDYTKEGLLSEFNARETKSNERGREGATSSSNVNWSAIRDNVKGEGNRISEQPSNDVIGEIQRKVREVKERTDRITGINKSEGQDHRGQQSDIQQDNKPRSGENQPSNIRTVEEPKPKVRKFDRGFDR